MLIDVDINKKSLKKIQEDIQKYSPYPPTVTLIAVTKTFSHTSIQSAEKNKINNIGENKVQETKYKISQQPFNTTTKFHLIGHLQRNKVSLAVSIYNVIQSVDSIKLLNKINNSAIKQNKKQKIFLQIKNNKQRSQSGFNKKEILKAAEHANQLSNIQTIGLMTIGPNTKNIEKIKKTFKQTKKTQQIINNNIDKGCKYLSMGMSQDYIIALQEGATHLRIGTKLFQKRDVK